MKAFVFKEPIKTGYTCFLIKKGVVIGKLELLIRKSVTDIELIEKEIRELLDLHGQSGAIKIYHG